MSISLLKILLEKKGDTYDKGAVMLDVTVPIMQIHKKIDKDDLYEEEEDRTYGLEDEPHITLLYDLEDINSNKVIKIIKTFHFHPLILHNISIFDNENYDVLKFDVKSPNNYLSKINKALQTLLNKNDFDYHPHLTVGYFKKGTVNKYLKIFKDVEFEVIPKYVIHSKPNGGGKIKIPIRTQLKTGNSMPKIGGS